MNLLDRIAARLAIWGLRRLYGADCDTNVYADFPDNPEVECFSCDAKKLVDDMRGLLYDPASPLR